MSNNILPVFETVEFLRVVTYGEGKRGKFAVAIVRREQNEFTTLFAHEQYPIEQVNFLKEGQIIKVRPSEYGLRAVLKDQDIELLAQNAEDIAIEVCHLKDKIDGLEYYWYESGKLYRELIYSEDELISEKKWNEDGSIF